MRYRGMGAISPWRTDSGPFADQTPPFLPAPQTDTGGSGMGLPPLETFQASFAQPAIDPSTLNVPASFDWKTAALIAGGVLVAYWLMTSR